MMAKYGARYLTKGESYKMPEGGHWKPLAASCAVDQVAEDEPTIFFAIDAGLWPAGRSHVAVGVTWAVRRHGIEVE